MQFPHDAYIWQRRWTEKLRIAIKSQAALFQEFRCLALQRLRDGRWIDVAIDTKLLNALPNSSWCAVIRIDGASLELAADELLAQVQSLRARLHAPQLAFELDFDCATSRLPEFARLLAQIAQTLKQKLRITALPAWLSSKHLADVLSHCASVTLQVHAVQNPTSGLFSAEAAWRWASEWDARTKLPFALALPTYGASIVSSGRASQVLHESEFTAPVQATELRIEAEVLAQFIRRLQEKTWRNLRRLIWFRLTIDSDTRALAPATVRALVLQEPLLARLSATQRPNAVGGFDVLLRNQGNVDSETPEIIRVDRACVGEGSAGYRFLDGVLRREQSTLLKAQQSRVIAWVRHCD